MKEGITFHFRGDLAESHKMNFYEAARFQYAAARWLVKLSRFRLHGKFPRSISDRSNINIDLIAQDKGSFNINVEDRSANAPDAILPHATISDLISYVGERIVEKIADGSTGDTIEELDHIAEAVSRGIRSLEELESDLREQVMRRGAEVNREQKLLRRGAHLERIDPDSGQRLVAMSAR